ncbi:MAG: hypothetical protein KatS3mg015_0720 [Fimbriimonadales bacterium]|nr:MAG: hypothetical protein KatS3mg015_0720 [Fimbriimonadales bacterium]
MRKLVMTIFGLSLIAGANAFVWVESGDAPEFVGGNTAQLVIGSGGLTEIQGMFHSGAPDADSYVIQITQPVSFEATTVGGTTADTQLFLFRLDGMGVLHNDDGAVTGDSLRSRIGVNGGPVMPANVPWTTWAAGNLPAGLYVISVSQYNRDPLAGGGLIWNNSPFNQQRTPDGPNAGSPVDAWGGGPNGTGITYSIFFQGADGVPEPATMLAIGAGLAALAARRRRK